MLRMLPVVLLSALPALAQTIPVEVQAIVDETFTLCGGDVTFSSQAITSVDLNGDGTPDWVVDRGAVTCATTAAPFCDTAGCGVITLIDGKRADLTLHRWGVISEGGKTYLAATTDTGKIVRYHWTGRKWRFLG